MRAAPRAHGRARAAARARRVGRRAQQRRALLQHLCWSAKTPQNPQNSESGAAPLPHTLSRAGMGAAVSRLQAPWSARADLFRRAERQAERLAERSSQPGPPGDTCAGDIDVGHRPRGRQVRVGEQPRGERLARLVSQLIRPETLLRQAKTPAEQRACSAARSGGRALGKSTSATGRAGGRSARASSPSATSASSEMSSVLPHSASRPVYGDQKASSGGTSGSTCAARGRQA